MKKGLIVHFCTIRGVFYDIPVNSLKNLSVYTGLRGQANTYREVSPCNYDQPGHLVG